MKTRKLTILLLFSVLCYPIFGQMDVNIMAYEDYKKPGKFYERINQVIGATNGDIVAVGEVFQEKSKQMDGLFLVLDGESMNIKVRKNFGKNGNDSFNGVVQNLDGTFTVVGYTVVGKGEEQEGWMLTLDLKGEITGEPIIRGTSNSVDELRSVAINESGDVLAAGVQSSKQNSAWLIHLKQENAQEHFVGEGKIGPVEKIVANQDQSFALVGTTPKANRKNPEDAWVMKVSAGGRDLWRGPKYFGDSNTQEGLGITACLDGGFAIAGSTTTQTQGKTDKWLVKLNAKGEEEWSQTYGGAGADIAADVIELKVGGFAVYGQSLSYLVRTDKAMLDIVITDELGEELDSEYVGGGGNDFAISITELADAKLVIAGSVIPEKREIPKLYVQSFTYREFADKKKSFGSDNIDGAQSGSLQISDASFMDNNQNRMLEANERGYLLFEVTNTGDEHLDLISAKVSPKGAMSGVNYWKSIEVGTLRSGETKKVFVPLYTKSTINKGSFDLGVMVEVDGQMVGSTAATIESNQPNPANLSVQTYHFSPNKNITPGTPVELMVELVNNGDLASKPVDAYFVLPPGIRSNDSEKISIPSIAGRDRKNLSIRFSFDESYQAEFVDIRFETRGTGETNIYKTFSLSLGSKAPIANVPDEMIWVSHDPDEKSSTKWAVNRKMVDVKVKALSRKQLEKGNFAVYINGKIAQGQKMGEEELTPPKNDKGRFRYSYLNRVSLEEGENKVKIVYKHEDGTVFASRELIFEFTPKDRPNLHVISIGIEYDNLKYTVKDARDFGALYEDLVSEKVKTGFKSVYSTVLVKKEQTTRDQLSRLFEGISHKRSGIKENDLLVIFISGHGKLTRFGDFILLPSDFKSDLEKSTSLSFDEDLLDPLRFLDCKKLVFLDACHSGNAFSGKSEFSDRAASKVMMDLINASSGMEIFASCGNNEFSYEDDSWQNGAFTKAIKEAFSNDWVDVIGGKMQADMYNNLGTEAAQGGDGIITIQELRNFVSKRVPYLVQKTKVNPPTEQNPSTKSTEMLPDEMGIYYISKEENN